MSDEIGGLLAAFDAATGLTDRRAAVEQAAARGQGLMLYELASALAGHIDDSVIPRQPYGGFLEHLSRVLALTPGSANAEWAARLATATSYPGQLVPPPRRIRQAARLLAARQPAEYLTPLFTAWPAGSGPELDFLGCLAQEMVLRHGEVTDPGALDVASRLRAAGHPLAVLPLFLLDPERQLTLPSYHYRGHSAGLPYGPYHPSAPPGSTAHPLPVPAGDVTDVSASQLIRTAVDGWVTHSRGKAEARVFRFGAVIAPAMLAGASLAALPLQALAGVPVPEIAAQEATSAGVFRILFAAASSGGAYGAGLGGAYGRLAAWQSLAGFTGQADPGLGGVGGVAGIDSMAGIDSVAAAASATRYLTFSARSRWYRQVAWDIGIAALRPGSHTLAILAATDTD